MLMKDGDRRGFKFSAGSRRAFSARRPRLVERAQHPLLSGEVHHVPPPVVVVGLEGEGGRLSIQIDQLDAAASAEAPIVVPVGRQFTFNGNQDPSKGPVNWGMKGSRWQKYFEVTGEGWNDKKVEKRSNAWYSTRHEKLKLRLGIAQWVCRTWNAVHGDTPYELQSVELLMYGYDLARKLTPPWTSDDVVVEQLFSHDCFEFRDQFKDLVDGENYNATDTRSIEGDTRWTGRKDKATAA